MAKQNLVPTDDGYLARILRLWGENQGWFLLGFAALIFVVGSGIMFAIQSRFVPPRFPDGDSIEQVLDPPDPSNEPREPAIEESLTIHVVGLNSSEGVVRFAFYENAESFNEISRASFRLTGAIVDKQSIVLILTSSLPEEFAIAAFHDKNLDGELNKSVLGIPTERYGFSRDARGETGPPTYQDALIERPEPGKILKIKLQ